MIALPFIYFSLFLIFIILRKGFELSAYITLIYVISSFFSIIIDLYDYRDFDTKYYEISLESALMYCFLLTLVILPFYNFDYSKTKFIPIINIKLFNIVVYIYIIVFVLLMAISFNSIGKILNGDLLELRKMHNSGEDIAELAISGGPIIILVNLLSMFSIIMIMFYFYSICFLKNSSFFNTMILISSLSIIIMGIIGVDRSKTIYWLLILGAMIVLFWKYMTLKSRRKVIIIASIIVTLILTYFISMTVARFGERDSGAEGGLILYAGQSYINFCMFYDEVHYKEFSLQKIFPLFYNLFVDNGISSSAELNNDITLKTGKFVSVFATFAGDIMVGSGKAATIIYCIIFSFIGNFLLKIKSSKIYFHHLIILFCLLLVPLLGVFSYFYNNHNRNIMLFFILIYAFNMWSKSVKINTIKKY